MKFLMRLVETAMLMFAIWFGVLAGLALQDKDIVEFWAWLILSCYWAAQYTASIHDTVTRYD